MMFFSSFLDVTVCEALAKTLLHSLWQVTLVSVIVAAVLRFSRGAGVRATCCALGLLLILLCLPITFCASWGSKTAAAFTPAVTSRVDSSAGVAGPATKMEGVSVSSADLIDPGPDESNATVNGKHELLSVDSESRQRVVAGSVAQTSLVEENADRNQEASLATWKSSSIWSKGVSLLYLVGVFGFAVRMLSGLRLSLKIRFAAMSGKDASLSDRATKLSLRLGRRVNRVVGVCAEVSGPVIVGVLRPVIIVPPALLAGLPPAQLEAVLLHEIAHLCRRDPLVLVMQRSVEAVVFFHPLVWWLSHQLSANRELACDDAVTGIGISPVCYAESLLRVAELNRGVVSTRLLAADGQGAGALVFRVERLLAYSSSDTDSKQVTNTTVVADRRQLRHRVAGFSLLQHAAGTVLLSLVIAMMAASQAVTAEANDETPAGATVDETAQAQQSNESVPEVTSSLKAPMHLLTGAVNNELVLVSLPHTDSADQTPTSRMVTKLPGRFGYEPIGIYRGHLVVRLDRKLVAVDLHSGEVRSMYDRLVLNAVISGKHLYFVALVDSGRDAKTPYAVMHVDLGTLQTQELCRLSAGASAMMQPYAWGSDFSLAVSRDGRMVAVTEHKKTNQFEFTPKCRVVFAGPGEEVLRTDFEFSGRLRMTGAGDHGQAPRIGWSDNETLVVADNIQSVAPGGGLFIPDDGQRRCLRTVKRQTLVAEGVCEIPSVPLGPAGPWFRKHADGRLVLSLGRLGLYEVDLPRKRIVEHRQLGPDCELQAERLIHRGKVLATDTLPDRVFVSENGHVAWLPTNYGPLPGAPTVKGFLRGPFSLQVHDSTRGTQEVLKQDFQRFWPQSQFPLTTFCRWISEADFKRTGVFDELPITSTSRPKPTAPSSPSVPSRPPVASRSEIADCIEVGLVTDKPVYLRHEPLVLTVTVKNLTDAPIRFESKRLMNGAQPFGLDIKSARTRQRVEIFDEYGNKPESDFLVLPPGQSTSVKCHVEVKETGDQEARLRFEQWSLWGGNLKATAKFTVKKETRPDILKGKFDRLMAHCVERSKLGYNTFSGSDFWQLGADGTPLMIDYLRTCSNDRLRAGLGLPGEISEDNLDYVEFLLQSNLNLSPETIAGLKSKDYTIANECRYIVKVLSMTVARSLVSSAGFRSKEPNPLAIRGRQMMWKAGKHQRSEIRRAIAESLLTVVCDEVDRYMVQAAEDTDSETASTAARYIAVRQQLSLHEWLKWAMAHPNAVSFNAANSITAELQQQWKADLGDMPAALSQIQNSPDQRQLWNSTLQNWVAWAGKNSRLSETYFDKEREAATRMQVLYKYWGEGGMPKPLRIPDE